MSATLNDIEDYLAGLEPGRQAVLSVVRSLLRQIAPELVESISYGMPTAKYRGQLLAHFAAWKGHWALYGQDAGLLTAEERAQHLRSRGTLQFKWNDPVPMELVERLIRARRAAIEST